MIYAGSEKWKKTLSQTQSHNWQESFEIEPFNSFSSTPGIEAARFYFYVTDASVLACFRVVSCILY